MSPEEKSAQYLDLNANQRLLEIQAEIVQIEKRRIYEEISEKEHEELREKIKFLVSEEKDILEVRYSKQKDIKDIETELSPKEKEDGEKLNKILKDESEKSEKMEGELKEIIHATQIRYWYEKWWGKLIIILIGALLVGFFGDGNVNIKSLFY